jgi:hypothetical protein
MEYNGCNDIFPLFQSAEMALTECSWLESEVPLREVYLVDVSLLDAGA